MTMLSKAERSALDNRLLCAALDYAARELSLFPCWWAVDGHCACGDLDCPSPAKHPLGAAAPHGFRDATTDPKRILAWWRHWPSANVAIATGRVSGIFVLDVDAHRGGDATLAELERQFGMLPATVRVQTPQGGAHYYFVMPRSGTVPCRSDVAPGIDVRGDGGYVLAPPSVGLPGPYLDEIGHELH
jgi:Bifunctional DNA primase/polymerase, N-terminal